MIPQFTKHLGNSQTIRRHPHEYIAAQPVRNLEPAKTTFFKSEAVPEPLAAKRLKMREIHQKLIKKFNVRSLKYTVNAINETWKKKTVGSYQGGIIPMLVEVLLAVFFALDPVREPAERLST
jgi:hypothetical protein